jgi:lipopolysaccharide biosynthesis regulator YciM
LRNLQQFTDSILALLALAACAVGTVASAGTSTNPGIEVQDLHYGEVLFHFYQEDEFTALTHLLAAREANRVEHHAAESELLLGGLYLSYGQHTKAGEIFDRLLTEGVAPSVRDRAWFYLGKVRYQRGWYSEAIDAFKNVGDELPVSLRPERQMLLAQSYMGQGKFADAAQVLQSDHGPADWLAFVRYNLGVAMVRLDRLQEGAELLDRVGRLRSNDDELQALRDKANLAMGYAYLQNENADQAKSVLERVRLHGPFSSKALLGVGWANVMLEDYRGALDPWLELQDRDLLDSAVQESLLAVPYAFSRLGADGSAAEFYSTAMRQFDVEMSDLDAAIRRTESGELIPALLQQDESELGRWHWQLEALPATNDARYLYHLIANHEFQDGLRTFRDLEALDEHLAQWQEKLEAYNDMIDTRSLAYDQRLPAVETRLTEIELTELQSRRDELVAEFADISKSRNIMGLANESEARLWSQLKDVEKIPAFGLAKSGAEREKHRVLKGTLLWELDREYKYRHWQQQRSIAELDEALSVGREFRGRTDAARTTVPQWLEEYRRRIDRLAPRIGAMRASIGTLLGRQQQQLQVLVAREFSAQKERLATYRVQARFALATIYDRATVASSDDGAVTE